MPQAFKVVWKIACSSPSRLKIVVPAKNSYLIKPVDFVGPCQSNVTLKVRVKFKLLLNLLSVNGVLFFFFTHLEIFGKQKNFLSSSTSFSVFVDLWYHYCSRRSSCLGWS